MRIPAPPASLLLLIPFCCLVPGAAFGQEQAGSETARVQQATPAPAPDVRTYTLPPEKYKKARELSQAWYLLSGLRFVWGLLILAGLLALRVTPQFRTWAERATKSWRGPPWLKTLAQAFIFVPLLFLTIRVLRLPLSIWGQTLALKYEISVQSWGSWAWDWTKGAAVNAAVGALVAWVFYAIIRSSPRRWWVWCWAATLPFVIAGVFLSPVLVDPLFYEYRPLERTQPALVTEVEKVSRRGGLEIPRERMFEMVASEKLRVANAYVTGIGASKRVVVWDTTLQMLDVPQTLAVFGHEMGHYVLNHIPKGIALAAVLLFALFWTAPRVMAWTLARWGQRWQIGSAGDLASLPILMILLSVAQFAAAPGINAYSRTIEHEADVYALEVIHGVVPDAGLADAQAHQILSEAGLEDPDPPQWAVWWLHTHPRVRDRIEFARTYDPWSRGAAPRFVK